METIPARSIAGQCPVAGRKPPPNPMKRRLPGQGCLVTRSTRFGPCIPQRRRGWSYSPGAGLDWAPAGALVNTRLIPCPRYDPRTMGQDEVRSGLQPDRRLIGALSDDGIA